jgi:hypothetical protein
MMLTGKGCVELKRKAFPMENMSRDTENRPLLTGTSAKVSQALGH